ncbi:MAG: hypothetical protein WCW44_02540 [archaeon]|jgi:uncharacterized membrane protein
MKFNHVCLLGGILLLILAMTVFAHASVTTLDCSSVFNCRADDYCALHGGQEALPGMYGNCGPGGSEPCTYSFTSQSSGEHICSVQVVSTGFGNASDAPNQNQPDEVTTISINGTEIGTTIDRYANPGDPVGTVFCGADRQTLSGVVTLQAQNSINLNFQASHAISSVIIDCQLIGRDCSLDSAPYIQTIQNKTIKYTENFQLDLWDYISDVDDSPANTNVLVNVNGASISCTVDNNRFLKCNAQALGLSHVTISATDACDVTTTKTFDVNVINQAPYINVPDYEKSCVSDLNNLIDLRNYSGDENASTLVYSIISESNQSLVDCNLVNNYFVSCRVNSCSENYSNIVVRTTDIFGLYDEDTFKLTFKNYTPSWNEIPSVCVNDSNSRLINLNKYASDVEDTNKLTFSIISQSNSNAVNCSIDSNYLSCILSTNQHLSNNLTIRATDRNGKYADVTTTISTNCFDQNDNPTDTNGRIYFESTNTDVCLETCTTYGTQVKLINNSGSRKCYNFEAESYPYNTLDVSVTPNEVCVNDKETAFLTLNANTCGADRTNYEVKLFADDTNLSLNYNFHIGNCSNFDGFRITDFDGKVCSGESKELSVFVRNTSSTTKKINLIADNGFVLPYFTKDHVDLTSGQEKIVPLVINAKNLATGKYFIALSGDADNYHIEKRLTVDVVDCSEIKERTFVLSAPNVCFDVRRGQTFESQFSIIRQAGTKECTYNPRDFFLSLYGMPSVLAYDKVSLNYGESKVINYTIQVPNDAQAGNQLLTISGSDGSEWNSFTEQKSICLNVLGEDHAGLIVRTQSKDIAWCSTEVFELELFNSGDFDANYTISALDLPTGVNASVSEPIVKLKKGERKIIYVAVTTTPFAQVRDNQSLKIKAVGPITLTSTIYFNVKGRTTFDDLEIVSSSKQITMKGNTSSTYDIVIRNNSDDTVKGILVSFENVPKDVNINSVTISSLASGASISVSGSIVAGDTNGVFSPVFVVSSGGMANKKPFSLTIESNPKSGFGTGLFAGLFGLGFDGMFGGVLGAILLAVVFIVLLAMLILGIAELTRPRKKEAWVTND